MIWVEKSHDESTYSRIEKDVFRFGSLNKPYFKSLLKIINRQLLSIKHVNSKNTRAVRTAVIHIFRYPHIPKLLGTFNLKVLLRIINIEHSCFEFTNKRNSKKIQTRTNYRTIVIWIPLWIFSFSQLSLRKFVIFKIDFKPRDLVSNQILCNKNRNFFLQSIARRTVENHRVYKFIGRADTKKMKNTRGLNKTNKLRSCSNINRVH